MADTKVIFVAFAIEDETQRDFLKGQSLHPRAPFEFIDMSVKQAYDSEWKDKVRTRIGQVPWCGVTPVVPCGGWRVRR